MNLQNIKSLDDFEQFGPTRSASERQVDDLCDMHSILEDFGSKSIVAKPTTMSFVAEALIESQEKKREIYFCPIDLSGNRNHKPTKEQTWMLLMHDHAKFVALNDTGAFTLETTHTK